jgi:hypothetical protein
MYFDYCTTFVKLREARNKLLRKYHPDANGNIDNLEIRKINEEYSNRFAELTLLKQIEPNADGAHLFLKGLIRISVDTLYKVRPDNFEKAKNVLLRPVGRYIGKFFAERLTI